MRRGAMTHREEVDQLMAKVAEWVFVKAPE